MSYATVAKGPVAPDSTPVDAVKIESSEREVTDVVSVSEGEADASATPEQEAPEKKKSLAPAPVPEKSAWGAPTAIPADGSINGAMWPTPDQASSDQSRPSGPKFTKSSSSTKWVPIPAKVVLSQSPRQGPKSSRPRKKTTKPKGKKDDVDSEDAADAAGDESGDEAGANYKFNSNSKSFRKFNGSPTNAQAPYQKRYQNGGFYHPQPYYNGQKPGLPNRGAHAGAGGRGGKPSNQRFYPNGNFRQQFVPMMPMAPVIPPALSPKQNPQEALVYQLDYYFSLDNLIRDIYLRKNMDGEGWVSLSLILNFKRVQLIVSSLEESVEGDSNDAIVEAVSQCVNLETNNSSDLTSLKLRVKENWQQWLMPEDQR